MTAAHQAPTFRRRRSRVLGELRKALLGGVALLAGLGCGIEPVSAETLKEALALAYDNNPRLLSSRAELRATDEFVPQALSGWRPTVTVDGQVGREWEDSSVAGSDDLTPRAANLGVTQPLYRGGRTVAGTRQAENQVLAQREVLESVEQDVLFEAVVAFMDVLRDEAVLRLNINNEQVLQRQLEAAQDRFEVGEITRTDVAQAESRLSGANSGRIAAEGQLTTSRAIYRQVIGQMPGSLVRPGPAEDLPATEDEAIASSDSNPNVQAAVYIERAAREGVDVVFGELLPEVSLRGDLTTGEDISQSGVQSDSAAILAQVVIPLYEAGATHSRVREAKERVSQRRQDIETQRRFAAQDATTAWRALETARSQIAAFESQVRAAEIALEGVQQEAAVGSRTVLDILDAEQELLDARVSLVRALRDEVVASYQLLAAVGRLTAADLDLPVEIYDVEEHYEEVRDKWWGVGPSID
ncbi:MAG: type I secretion protein TolC [Alphaproteobacteria bacterium]|nr:MAG: type I secretion protein TolC [Alphaproteobacteria bacterium]